MPHDHFRAADVAGFHHAPGHAVVRFVADAPARVHTVSDTLVADA
jgi:hypothetical protein